MSLRNTHHTQIPSNQDEWNIYAFMTIMNLWLHIAGIQEVQKGSS